MSKLTRKERCQDCISLVETPKCEYFCDELQKPCEDVAECPEWDRDPSVYDLKGDDHQ